MSKKKFKKIQKEAEQQMESAERLSRLMDMFESGEISAEEFNELINSDSDVSDIEIDSEINGMLSGAFGRMGVSSYNTNKTPKFTEPDQLAQTYIQDDIHDKRKQQQIQYFGTLYQESKEESVPEPLSDIEASILLSQMEYSREKTTEEVADSPSHEVSEKETVVSAYSSIEVDVKSDIEDEFAGDIVGAYTQNGATSPIIPGVSDVLAGTGYDIDEDELFTSPNHLVLVDDDDKAITIAGNHTGFVASMQLFGEEHEFNFTDAGFDNPKDVLDIIRRSLVFCSGEYIISDKNHGLESLMSSVSALDEGRFMIYHVNHNIEGINPYYIMYDWTDDVEAEFYEMIEWLEENDLLLAFMKGICDLASNSTIFPLYEEPKRTKYVSYYWAEHGEVTEFIDSVNSDARTEFGVVGELEFCEKCTTSLDSAIDEITSLYSVLSELYYKAHQQKQDINNNSSEEAETNDNVNDEFAKDVAITPESHEVVEIETTTENTVEVEVEEVENTDEIELTTKRTETEENKYIMTPIV